MFYSLHNLSFNDGSRFAEVGTVWSCVCTLVVYTHFSTQNQNLLHCCKFEQPEKKKTTEDPVW